jgi:hypothetical protein
LFDDSQFGRDKSANRTTTTKNEQFKRLFPLVFDRKRNNMQMLNRAKAPALNMCKSLITFSLSFLSGFYFWGKGALETKICNEKQTVWIN